MGTTRDAFATVLDDLAGRLEELEELGDVPDGIGAALVEAGIVRLLAPRSHGGIDASLVESMEILEDIAAVDASVAWRSLVACGVAPLLARLPEPTYDALYSAGPDFVGGALYAPKGTAVETAGGFRVSGRWPNATGCDRCVWLCAVCMVVDSCGEIRRKADGSPVLRTMVLPAANARPASTWHTVGLRAAGGHDVIVDDVFVPSDRSFDLFEPPPRMAGGVASLPVLSLFSLHAAAVALGIAGAALADAERLAAVTARRLGVDGRPTADEPNLGSAQATIANARELLYRLAAALGDATDGAVPDLPRRVEARATGAWVVAVSASVVATAYEAVGGEAAGHASLARRFRDIHALGQHAALIQDHLSPAGAVIVGSELAAV